MALPKSVTKVSKDGKLTFTSNVDACSYTLKELARAGLRDVGKYVCKIFRNEFYSIFSKKTFNVGRATQYWVRYKQEDFPNLQVGIKPNGFYGGFQEVGSSKQPKLGLLTSAVENHVPEIIEIESKYLSFLEDEAAALAHISEEDYEGSADE